MTEEFSYGMQQTISAVFKPMAGLEGAFEYGFDQNWSSSVTKSTDMSTGQKKEISVTCNDQTMGLKTKGNWSLWQWTLARPDLNGRTGFNSYTVHFFCTYSLKPPQFPPNECGGRMCYISNGNSDSDDYNNADLIYA